MSHGDLVCIAVLGEQLQARSQLFESSHRLVSICADALNPVDTSCGRHQRRYERSARLSAEKWATSLAQELAELRRALTAGHTKLSLPPPWDESGDG